MNKTDTIDIDTIEDWLKAEKNFQKLNLINDSYFIRCNFRFKSM